MYERDLTPGQYVNNLLKEDKKYIPDFYRSDLQEEFNKIWVFQQQYYPEFLTDENQERLSGLNRRSTQDFFTKTLKIELSENKGKRDEIRSRLYQLRSEAVNQQISLNEVAYVLTEINNNINSSSGYLGEISDRSKTLFFNDQTVGEYLYGLLKADPNTSLTNMVFYRQDYLNEFDKIWNTQSKYYTSLTDELKAEIRDKIIFYQRRLKSQKHLLSDCEFEKYHKVCPKSSPLFQEFKTWQTINNLKFKEARTNEVYVLSVDDKNALFEELNFRGEMNTKSLMKFLGIKGRDWEVNYEKIEANRTNAELLKAYVQIAEMIGGYEIDTGIKKISIEELKDELISLFKEAGIDTRIFVFDPLLEGNEFDKQPSFQLWHLLYSSEDHDHLVNNLINKFGFKKEYANILANISLQSDHGSLSAKAIRKIIPHLMLGFTYDDACVKAGYNHSSSQTKEQNEFRILEEHLQLLPKNSLRNPVVEKILNQMVNVINAIIDDPQLGKPDEIRVELARELKKKQ